MWTAALERKFRQHVYGCGPNWREPPQPPQETGKQRRERIIKRNNETLAAEAEMERERAAMCEADGPYWELCEGRRLRAFHEREMMGAEDSRAPIVEPETFSDIE